MKTSLLFALTALVICGVSLTAQQNAQRKGVPGTQWRVQLLHKDNNEGLAVGDINGDGKLDITAGEFWYAAPDFERFPIRKLVPFGADYLQSSGEHLYDMDGDGDLDVLSIAFTFSGIMWYENPGPGNYSSDRWTMHELIDTNVKANEAAFFHDIDKDGTPEWIINSWVGSSPTEIYRLVRATDGKVKAKKHTVADATNGHGMGFGDINGDGKDDIIFGRGWFECPAAGPFSGLWTWHHDFDLPHASCPVLVVDLNADGRNDIIWGNGHNYGLYWMEQLEAQSNGATTWRQRLIDDKFSQAHALAWEDLDGDGKPELITGKRYYAHSGKDPGANDPITVQYYKWNKEALTWSKHLISEAAAGEGPGIGLQIRVADLDGNGLPDVITPGKSGTHILWNEG
ncbi:MAG: VCBS repeat-containing protein [Akkermansiaceae bacterium]